MKFVQELGKDVLSCSTDPDSESCHRGQAMQDALAIAIPAGLGGGVLAAATTEIAAMLKAGLSACTGNVVLCVNNLGLQASEVIVPGGVGAGGAIGIGKTAAEAAAAKAESVAANAAKNAANAPKLNIQLSAQEIANGHAFEKHVLQRGEFDALGIKTRNQFKQHVENVINRPTDVRYYSDGRVAYLDSTTRTVVIRKPGKGESTAFRPDYDIGWDNYIKRLPTQKTPPIK